MSTFIFNPLQITISAVRPHTNRRETTERIRLLGPEYQRRRADYPPTPSVTCTSGRLAIDGMPARLTLECVFCSALRCLQYPFNKVSVLSYFYVDRTTQARDANTTGSESRRSHTASGRYGPADRKKIPYKKKERMSPFWLLTSLEAIDFIMKDDKAWDRKG